MAISDDSRSELRNISSVVDWTGTPNPTSLSTLRQSSSVSKGLKMYSSARSLNVLCCSNLAGTSSDEVRMSGMFFRSALRLSLLQMA